MDVSFGPLVAVYPIIVMATLWMFNDAGDIMSSDVDSEADSDIAYEIVDVVETGSFSDSEDGCPDESGDELPTLTGGAHFQAPIPSENNPSQSHLHGEIGTAEGQTTNYEVLKSMDVVGKEFASEEKAELFFTEYARAIGFGVRRHNKRWNTKGMLIGRIWVCSKQGFRSKKFLARDNRKREARPITRTGCEVEFRIGAKQGESGWVCTHFNGKHNHTLTPPQQVHYIRSHRRITEPDLAAASSLNKVGVRPSQIHEYMVDRCDGRPVLMTHMKPFESAAADVYTRPIFRLKVAAKSCEAYELAIAGIHKLSMQLEPMSCEMAKEKPKGNLGRRFDVNDPVVVLTKGCGKKLKMGPSQQRKCSRCGNGGHTVRKCKIIIQPDGDHNDNPNQSSQFMGENTALPATRRSGIIDKGKEHNRTNEYDQHCSQQSHNGRATSSNLWYQPYAMSTDNDSTEDTMLQHLLPDYVVHHASASTFASTYANIWGGNQI
ncbi:hypothetical protein WN944_005901 [Citrus x changshan-huyou]|uniref:CCHC-type domain-containing protein n=1 Tax=Citrus x changshan-huyou TaxID=2935761 RepID=A0AAP0QT02_9ROSI